MRIRLKVGTYTFALSPKDSLNFEYSRNIYKLDTVGTPTYQDLGIDEDQLSFSGTITGNNAWSQAMQLKSVMDSGLPQPLLYGPIQLTVRVASFSPKVKRFDRIDYDLTLKIVESKSGYNAPQQPSTATSTTLPTKTPPAATSSASIAQYLDKTYLVKQGDTLWGIAQRILGSGASASDIATLSNTIAKGNQITNPKTLQIGQVLKVPSTPENQQSANTAYTARQTATISSNGISYLQTQEATVRFTPGAAS